MKNFIIGAVAVVILIIAATWWSKSLQSGDSTIIARKGLHWHPELVIYVKGEKQIIPVDIGIGPEYASAPNFDARMRMTPMHTHDDAPQGIIHLEFQGVVRKKDTTLGQFLKVWGKDINSFGSNVKMTVNGVANTEFENYEMKDGDKIELMYE